MREIKEIKFRGKRLNDGRWVYGNLIHKHKESRRPTGIVNVIEYVSTYIVENNFDAGEVDVDPDTVGQFTGAYDKYGKEIWEGDILSCTKYNHKYYVTWDEDNYCWYFTDPNNLCDYEVIGNIYDNPDLITK